MIDFSMSDLEEIYNSGKLIADYFYDKQNRNTNNSQYKEVTRCLTFLGYINETITSFITTVKSFNGDLIHNKKYLDLGNQIKEIITRYNEVTKLLSQIHHNNIAVNDNLLLFHEYYVNFTNHKKAITKLSQLISSRRRSTTYNNIKEDRCMVTLLNHLDYLQQKIIKPIITDLEEFEPKTSK